MAAARATRVGSRLCSTTPPTPIALGPLSAQLTTWFQRLTHHAAGVRITVDQRIEFARPVGIDMAGELAAPRAVIGRGPPLVLEVKLRVAPPAWLVHAMRRLFLVTRFSKYRDGMLALRQVERLHPPDPPLVTPEGSHGVVRLSPRLPIFAIRPVSGARDTTER